MTERLQPLSTQIAIPSQNLFPQNHSIPVQDAPQKVEPTVEEEPYTIKCICNFSDDDGNTIYCETCDTWQHIECFYPNNVEEALRDDFVHSCHTCKPRHLDHQRAVQRQKSRISMAVAEQETAHSKPKRPPSKSHKKKPKPTDLQLNGHTSGSESNKHSISHDHPPPTKKAKTSHKPSHSISSQAAKRSPSYGTGRGTHQGHPPSPATTPPDLPSDFEIHNYSAGFVSLHKEEDVQIVQTNSYAGIKVSNAMSLWLREPDKMLSDTGKHSADVFQPLPPAIGALKRPLHVEDKKLALGQDSNVRLQFLTTPIAVEKDTPLMELNGQIGFQSDYCADVDNRYEEMCCSPLPFVFFHPLLPLYIDTRREGSQARYVRRSCKPNAVLDTFLSGGSEYQFWLVSDRHIGANEQVTIPWDFRIPKKDGGRILRLLGLGDEDAGAHDEHGIDEAEYSTIANWVHLILSEYGGCACELGGNCAFARFHRNFYGKLQSRPSVQKKKSRKPKNHAISPTSTGHATNSRAASEGHLDDGGEHDARSTSGSSRSKPPSRDMTPARQGSFDTLGILTEPTDRDKRKVAMAEDTFRRLEQQPARKKKRLSDGPPIQGTLKPSKPRSSTSGLPNGANERSYVDAGTSRSKSGSPSSAVSPNGLNPFHPFASRPSSTTVVSRHSSVPLRPTYCSVGVQTDPVGGEWFSEPNRIPKPKRRIVSLSKRLLDNRHRSRLDEEEKRKSRDVFLYQQSPVAPVHADASNADQKPLLTSPSIPDEADRHSIHVSTSGDTAMTDAGATSPGSVHSAVGHSTVPSNLISPAKKSPDLRVQMPPVPVFNNSGPNMAATATTPLSASSIMQSPFSTSLPSPFAPTSLNGIAANPSPVKKKLSLSDYTKSRKAAAGRPALGTLLKPTLSNADEPKSATSADGSGGVDSPTDKAADHLASTNSATNGSM